MAIATLSIDIVARLASLTQSLSRVEYENKKAADRVAAQWDTAGKAISATFAGLGIAAIVSSQVARLRDALNGLDALNDIKDATGSSIENISALEDAAKRTGTTTETVAASLIKFNKALSDTADSDGARAVELLGLNFKELKALDPSQAFFQVSKALATFADDGYKARIVMELFGKSTKEAAPFLSELAKQTELVATVTTAQAEAAEKFNQQLASLSKNSEDVARSFVSTLLPSLSSALQQFKDAKEIFGGFWAALYNVGPTGFASNETLFKQAQDGLAKLAKSRKDVEEATGYAALPVFKNKRLAALDEEEAKLKKLEELYRRALPDKAGFIRSGFENTNKASIGALPEKKEKDKAEKLLSLKDIRPRDKGDTADLPFLQGRIDAIKALAATPSSNILELGAAIEQVIYLRDTGKADAKTAGEAIAKLREQMEDLDPAKKAAKEFGKELQQMLEATDLGQLERLQKALNGLLNLEPSAKSAAAIKQLRAQITELSKSEEVKEAEKQWVQFGQTIEGALGSSVLSAIQGNFKSIGDMWKNLIQQMIAQALTAKLVNALFGDSLKGGSNAGLFGDLFKAVAGGVGTSSTASGGGYSGIGNSAKALPPIVQYNTYTGGVSAQQVAAMNERNKRDTIAAIVDMNKRGALSFL